MAFTFGGQGTQPQPALNTSSWKPTLSLPGQQPFTLPTLGSATPQQPSFGTLGSATPQQPSFGTLGSTPQQPTFGSTLGATPQQPTFGSTLGSTPQQPTFGSTLGSPAQQPTFGSTLGSTPQQPTFGSTLGSTTQQPSFGTTLGSTPQQQAFGFGGSQTAATQPATTAAAPPFSFGTPFTPTAATTAPPSFGFTGTATTSQPATTSAAPSFNLGSFQPAATTTTASTFGFGTATPAATTAAPPSFGFGSNATASGTPNFGFGSNLTSATTTTTSAPTAMGGLLGQPISTPATQGGTFVGLGGVSIPNSTSSSLGYATGAGIGKGDTRTGKEAIIPIELTQLAEELKQHMRSEKILLAEIAKRPEIPVDSVSQHIDDLKNTLNNITRLVHHQKYSYDTFVKEMNQVQKDLEMAIECNETPPHLRRELCDTTPFYERLLEKYGRHLKFYEREAARIIEVFRSGCDPEEITARELFGTLQSTNDTVMALAAKVQNYHEKVSEEITAFRNLQRMILGESKFVEEAPATASAIGDMYNRMYEKANVYFSPNIEASGITNFLHNQPSPAKGATSPTALTSTPIFPRVIGFQSSKLHSDNTSFNYPGGYGSPQSLFQTQTSAIGFQSPTGQANTSLKRSKR